MGADTGDTSFIQHYNLFRVHNGGNSLGYNQDSSVLSIPFQGFPQFCVGLEVQSGEGVVKNIDGGFFHQCSGDGKPLALAAGNVGTALADFRLKAFGKFVNKFRCLGDICAGFQQIFPGVFVAVAQVAGNGAAEQQSLLVDVRDDAQWLIRVVENLLSITRIGNESAKITKEPEAAEEVLDEAVRKFRKRFPAVSVEVHVPDELLLVPMDAILIMQVLSNLMENAVFHGGTTTHIALSAQRDGPWARFYVRDNGQGIPPQKLHTLFSGALRCEDSSPGDGKRNMGLGLSVCMAIIRAHGGTLEAKNLESGAEFSFCLPLTKEEVS